uniref:DUF2177 family protein n=1 Tax=viral metagenome TaxID=1070528 RepID=A0A6C0JYW5_9ZZZZ
MNCRLLLQFFITFVVFVTLDSIYLTSMKGYFDNQVKLIQGSVIKMNLVPAVLCYISLVFGVYYFIIKERKPLLDAFLLGLVIYTVYEFTNWALFNSWKPMTVVIDSLWGATLFTLTTAISYFIYGKLNKG